MKNNKGFSVFFLLLLPTLLALLALVYHVIYLIEFKNEFRFKCINESLLFQKSSNTNTTSILDKLKSITTPIKYEIHLSEYQQNEESGTLVFEINYKWFENFYLKCGAKRKKEGVEWQYEIIYSTINVDKF